MSRFCIAIFFCFSAIASAQTIPIESVWSNGIENTRNINKLDPKHRVENTVHEYPTIGEVGRLLIRDRRGKLPPIQAVIGSESKALIGFLDFLNSGKQADLFSTENVSLIFFTDLTSTYIVLDSIERKGDLITINYHHQTHATMQMDWYVAIIPLGKLPAGEYRVSIHRKPTMNQKGERASTNLIAEQIVCRGTTFQIHAR